MKIGRGDFIAAGNLENNTKKGLDLAGNNVVLTNAPEVKVEISLVNLGS